MVPSQPSLLYVVQAGSDVFQTELFPPRIPHLKRYIYAHLIYQEDGFISEKPRGHVNAKGRMLQRITCTSSTPDTSRGWYRTLATQARQ